ncbi:inner membrane CreD family protein [Myxococcota bacterium]|nr:inner membrane CreD family protein [Myxococcota bacterium]
MHPVLRIFGIGTVFAATSIAWLILGGVTQQRTREQSTKLEGEVDDLWGTAQVQQAPALTFEWRVPREVVKNEVEAGTNKTKTVRETVWDAYSKDVSTASTNIDVSLALDQRLKGLMWYSLYDVGFDGKWSYVHGEPVAGVLRVAFQFPDATGVYDRFRFVVAGRDRASELRPVNGRVEATIDVAPGDEIEVGIAYQSRGLDAWRYTPAQGVASLTAFRLTMKTDFDAIDFPRGSMSPGNKEKLERGWKLDWAFDRVVTGHDIGMAMPSQLQPGELAAALSFSAPISLFFFFLVIFVLATMRSLEIHPINYLFLGGAFFAFHLLFAYSVDHLALVPAFVLSSVTSVMLVVSYLRLVVSPRFAFVEAGLAQLVYLVGFSLAHFWAGFTGLTVTVLSIATLFVLMQLTGRIRWSDVLAREGVGSAVPGHAGTR